MEKASAPMQDWKERFRNPADLRLYVMHTGEVRTGKNIHCHPRSPKFKEIPKEDRFNPVFAYLVVHPRKGLLLLDTGLHGSFSRKRFGNFGALIGSMVHGRSKPDMDVCSQLWSLGMSHKDVGHIFLSHLHLDHPSGLPYFAGRPGLGTYVDPEELKLARSPFGFRLGYIRKHLEGIAFRPIPYGEGIAPFDRVCDFFGDGSVFLVATPGHTVGHASAILNASGGPIVLTFDAAHRRSNLLERVPPVGDYGKSMETLEKIGAFLEAFPDARVVFGHDPDQLETLLLAPKHYS